MQEYPAPLRITSDIVEKRSDKHYVEVGELRDFLRGRKRLVVEEKLDGSQMAIGWKGGQLYLQGHNSHIQYGDKQPPYAGVREWASEQDGLLQMLQGYLVFGEWLKIQHHVVYDSLPAWFVAYDVWDGRTKRFLTQKMKHRVITGAGLFPAPILYEGKVTLDLLHELTINQTSTFGSEQMEGCVIKDYELQRFLKLVVREFEDTDTHWTSPTRQMMNICL